MRMAPSGIRTRGRWNSGFTILEILIAMVVLTVGVLGLLALFPIGIQSTTHTVRDSRSSLLARSIQEAITVAMRVSPDETTNAAVLVQHDGFAGGQYTFARPLVAGAAGQIYCPAPGGGTDPTGDTFELAKDAQAFAAVQDIRDPAMGLGIDPTEPTQQYSFGFLVQRVGNRLFQVTVDVFRAYRQDPNYPPDHLTAGWATSKHPTEVYSFTFLVAGN